MPRTYVLAKIEDELQVKEVRDVLWASLDARKYYKKVDPHITVIPPFTVKPGYKEQVTNLVTDTNISGREVTVNGVEVYKSIEEPYVVLLDVDVKIEDVRDQIMEKLQEYVDGKIVDPVSPHITLFKTQGWWEDIDDNTRGKLEKEVRHRNSLTNTEITNVKVDFKE